MNLHFYVRWFTSHKVRQATELKSQAVKLLNHQRDLMKPEAVQAVEETIRALKEATHGAADRPTIESRMEELEKTANKWFHPYSHPSLRENLEVFLVAGAVALAVRTFFFQPMAIPTGSAQPTFNGITHQDYRGQEEVEIPGAFGRFYERWVKGRKYVHIEAREAGSFEVVDRQPRRVFLWIKKQRFRVGDEQYTVWFPPDQLFGPNSVNRSGLIPGQYFKKGEDIIKLRVVSGDHLFVNRFVYNFRRPKRGETIVFVSFDIPGLISNTHYIKRLVAMDGDEVSIGNDRHIVRNGKRLDASTPGFEFVYGEMGPAPKESEYSGHVNGTVAARYRPPGSGLLASNFPTEEVVYKLRPKHCMTFGDNTMNSFDSRDWPTVDFPQEKVIGRSGFVFWPISDRFGWHQK